MVRSMSGFGRGEYSEGGRSITVEIKSVNHRFSDMSVRIPRRYAFSEEAIKAVLKGYAPRGRLEVSVNVESAEGSAADVVVDLPLARRYFESLSELKASVPDAGGEISIELLASMPDLIRHEAPDEDEEDFQRCVLAAANEAGAKLLEMKEAEGAKLADNLLMHCASIEEATDEIAKRAPSAVAEYTDKMRERIAELLGGAEGISEERILLEAAVFADKSDISEEIARLRSHTAQFRAMLGAGGEPVGKALDFLAQEMNREANTIASKANDIDITSKALSLKNDIEKIREQVQNIE